MKLVRLIALTIALLLHFQSTARAAEACDEEKMAVVRGEIDGDKDRVWVDCNLTLEPDDVIYKTLRIQGSDASDITIDCNGATLDGGPSAEERIHIHAGVGPPFDNRPENVTVRRCTIYGRVKVGETLPGSPGVTWQENYPELARAYAPKDIRFEKVVIHADGEVPVYVYPGVEHFQLIDSRLYGTAPLALYLDAESHRNEIRNNHFSVNTTREIIAVDGSSENLIVNNYFVYTKNGGIYLYRNCGEAPGNSSEAPGTGSIRHTTPSFNLIINNRFNNGNYAEDKPNIWLGARNGLEYEDGPNSTPVEIGYCDADLRSNGTAYPFGSSLSDLDFASDNVVMQNQFYNRSPADMVVIGRPGRPETDRDNVVEYNQQVSSGIDREAGCYHPSSVTSPLIVDGATKAVMVADPSPRCEQRTCNDGVLTPTGTCSFVEVDFGCQVTSNNSGCHSATVCPTIDGRPGRVASAKAACNLESGSVTTQQVNDVPLGDVSVVLPSSNLSDGVCYVEQTDIADEWARIWASKPFTDLSFGCMENDSNGGDCHIKGKLYCE